MAYLVCDKCGGYYELQPGESPDDFDRCECGGKLKHIQTLSDNTFDKSDNNYKDHSALTLNKSNLMIILFLVFGITAISGILYSTQVLNPTTANYTLLGSYNVNDLAPNGKAVNLPQGTKNIKVDYNISWIDANPLNSNLYLDTYNIINSGGIEPAGNQNIIDTRYIKIKAGQNKTGTYYFNNPSIKSIGMNGNGIQGTVKIYTA
jgi:hypothetical protein